MTDELPVPFELMEFSVCGCKTNRNARRWKCIKYQLIGTDLYTFVSVRTMVHILTPQCMIIALKINFDDYFC